MDAATLYMVVAVRGEPHSTPNKVFETVGACEAWVAEYIMRKPRDFEVVTYECRRWRALAPVY